MVKLLALDEVHRARDARYSIMLAAVADEESTFAGVRALIATGLQVDGAIVGEPTELQVVTAHKGVIRFWVEVQGRAAHSALPEQGVNAIELMGRVLDGVVTHLRPALASRTHPLVGSPTLSVTLIEGGRGPNTIPDTCRAHIDRRTIPGEDPLAVWAQTRDALNGIGADGGRIVVYEPYLVDHAAETSADAQVVRIMMAAAAGHLRRPVLTGMPYTTDASKLVLAGIPSVVFGPGKITDAHAADESVSLDEVAQAARVLVTAARGHGYPKILRRYSDETACSHLSRGQRVKRF